MPNDTIPVAALLGGGMIGLSAVLLMATHGRIAGISGIVVRMFPPYLEKGMEGRILFILGLSAAPLLFLLLSGQLPTPTIMTSPSTLVASGLLVGFGSIWGNGCTSGHGVCGLSRLSWRSMVAVTTFMSTAAITVLITNHVL
jgi:uncharacterized membrane protein YedE/YeeE